MTKIKPIILASILVTTQPTISFSENVSHNSPVSNKSQQSYNAGDDFHIDFDALDEELDALNMGEKNPENPWWITKQIKSMSTKVMIKLLLTYVNVQETCIEQWDVLSKKISALTGLLYGQSKKQQTREQQEL